MNTTATSTKLSSGSPIKAESISQSTLSFLKERLARQGTRPSWWTAIFVSGCLAIGGCGTLLKDNFEGYDEGSPVGIDDNPQPGAPIPGTPSGDRIIPEATSCSGATYSVRSAGALKGQKSLVLQYARLPHCDEDCAFCEELGVLSFVPKAPSNDGRPVYLSWEGRLTKTLADTMVEITAREAGEFFSTVRLAIGIDRLEVFRGTALEKVIVHDFGTTHGVIIRLSPKEGTYGVQVSGPGLVTPPNNVDPCVFPNVVCGQIPTDGFDVTALQMRMQFVGTPPGVSALSQPEYRVDNVQITQRRF